MSTRTAPAFRLAAQQEFERLLGRYPTKQAALLPTLRLVEREFGEVSPDGLKLAARLLDLAPAFVYGVFTFYTHYRRAGTGRFRVMACRTLPCALAGAARIHRHLEKRLGIPFGQTSKDGRWTLEYAECLAACGQGPCVEINDDYYENLTVEKLDELLDALETRAAEETGP